jgi:transposase
MFQDEALEVAENMRLLYLPPYSPELNPVENIWEELREKFFHNYVFNGMDSLEEQMILALRHLEGHPETTKSISAWHWIT